MGKIKCAIKECKRRGIYFFAGVCGWVCSLHYGNLIQKKIDTQLNNRRNKNGK